MLIPLAVQISAARVYGYNVLLFCFSGTTIYNTRNHNMTALYYTRKNAYWFLERKYQGKKPLGRHWHNHEENIKTDVKNWMGELWLD
jgi:hypothetical protein